MFTQFLILPLLHVVPQHADDDGADDADFGDHTGQGAADGVIHQPKRAQRFNNLLSPTANSLVLSTLC